MHGPTVRPQILLKPISSLEKCFLDDNILFLPTTDRFTVFRGQPLAFGVAVSLGGLPEEIKPLRFPVRVSGDLTEYIRVRSVLSVAVHYPALQKDDPSPYLRTSPGLYPDLLRPLHYDGQLTLPAGQTQTLWISADLPEALAAGTYTVTISVGDAETRVTVCILSHALPPQRLIHTEWLYVDCLADFYHVPVFSEAHWEIIAHYIRTAVKNGINMILTPIFTPELDTYIGGERTTTQLVGIRVVGAERYEFDFSLLGRWIELCRSLGVEYLEMPHFFSQWGATATPKLVAEVNGETKRIFGWETDSLGSTYETFLSQFLPALVAFLRESGMADKTYFHVSDEPKLEQLEQYRACKELLTRYLGDLPLIDALSDYAFYETGAIEKPVPAIKHIQPFLDHRVSRLWAYYCGCGTAMFHITGRMLAQRLSDTRAIGIQLWQNRIEGFLHWGYNFWNTQYSYDRLDPYLQTCGDYFAPSGDTMLVYPGTDGEAWESLRLNAMREAMEDMRMLDLCASIRGRAFTEALLRETAGETVTFHTLPDAAFYERLRERVAEALKTL